MTVNGMSGSPIMQNGFFVGVANLRGIDHDNGEYMYNYGVSSINMLDAHLKADRSIKR